MTAGNTSDPMMQPSTLNEPGSRLASVFEAGRSQPQILLVTGDSGAGKTTWCAALIDAARAAGLTVGGLLCPAVFNDGAKTGIDMRNLLTGETRRLAQRRTPQSTGVMTIHWHFDESVLDWGNAVLRELPPVDTLIIDELGPLELIRGEGLLEALTVLDRGAFQVACVIVRLGLVEAARQRWPGALVVDVESAASGQP
ncbi:MAG: nucleoside-triphosphatase [Phototrophicaceae bacterium]